jgi:hypothetical protein
MNVFVNLHRHHEKERDVEEPLPTLRPFANLNGRCLARLDRKASGGPTPFRRMHGFGKSMIALVALSTDGKMRSLIGI